jgi:hypothetical protein
MKVLFLDIDGVLNSARTCLAHGGYPHEFGPTHMAMFDTTAVALIRGLCKTAGVSVVVSSAWRITHTWQEIGAGLDLPTIDSTPRLVGPRGAEIQAWLDAHPSVTMYAIVDDDSDMLPEQAPNFVQTSGFEGLSFSNFERLCALFGVDKYDVGAPERMRIASAEKLEWKDAA